MISSVVEKNILFSTKLAAIANVCKSGDTLQSSDFLIVRRPYQLLGLIPLTRFDCRLWIASYNDNWSVMLSPRDKSPDGIIGVDYAHGVDAHADALFISAWRRICKQWTCITPPGESEIRHRIENAVTLAYQQYFKN